LVTGQQITITATPAGYDFYDFMINNSSVQTGSSNLFESYSLMNGDQVTVKVTDGNCTSNASDTLLLDIKPLPNAFTPNGDGKNDLFIKGLDVTILNRWGQQLFQGVEGWDGTYNGKPVTPGTYYYVIRLKQPDGTVKLVQGPLTLIAE
jgi:gliding motility-associated-like protein